MSEASGSGDQQTDLSEFAASSAYGHALAQAWYKKQQGELHPFVQGELELYRWFAHVAIHAEVHEVEFEPHPGGSGFVRSVYYKRFLFTSPVGSEEALLTLGDASYVETCDSGAPPRGVVPAMFVTSNTGEPQEHIRTPLKLLDRIVWGRIGAEDDEELLEAAIELADIVIEGGLDDDPEALEDPIAHQKEFTQILGLCARSLEIGPPPCPRISQTPEFIVPQSAFIPDLS